MIVRVLMARIHTIGFGFLVSFVSKAVYFSYSWSRVLPARIRQDLVMG